MKKIFIAVFALSLMIGCGKDGTNGQNGSNGSNGANAPTDASILSSFISEDPNSAIPALDLSGLSLNAQLPATFLGCDTSGPDQSGTDTPVGFFQVHKGNVYINGSAQFGIIQFGQQPHSSHSGVCYVVGQEAYSYLVNGNELTLCDMKYGVCGVMSKQ